MWDKFHTYTKIKSVTFLTSVCVAHRIGPVYKIFAEPYRNQIVRNKCMSLFGRLQSDFFDRLLCKSVI